MLRSGAGSATLCSQSRPPNQESELNASVQCRGPVRNDSHRCSEALSTEGARKIRYLVITMDCFTKWPEAYAILNQEASTVVEALVTNFCSFGVPRELHSDQDRNFESRLM
jgi:hypothetical protein